MRRNFNVIQINGFRGILLAIFVVCCLIAGFGVFPGFLAMNCWNFSTSFTNLPQISMAQGILLWAIIAFSYFTFKKKNFIVSFKSHEEMSEEELKTVVEKIKLQSIARANINRIREEALRNLQKDEFEFSRKSINLSETISDNSADVSAPNAEEKDLCVTNDELKG